jgi:hypothetical protein
MKANRTSARFDVRGGTSEPFPERGLLVWRGRGTALTA